MSLNNTRHHGDGNPFALVSGFLVYLNISCKLFILKVISLLHLLSSESHSVCPQIDTSPN